MPTTKSSISHAARWQANADAVIAFRIEHGRLPSYLAVDDAERRIGHWLREQRRAVLGKGRRRVTPDRVNFLNAHIGGWRETARSSMSRPRKNPHIGPVNDAFARAVAETNAWFADHGRFPLAASQGRERTLAQLLSRARTSLRRGELHPDRKALLDAQCPGWFVPEVSPHGNHQHHMRSQWDRMWWANAAAVIGFYTATGRYPSQTAKDPAERRLGLWIRDTRVSARGTNPTKRTLTAEQIAYLDEGLGAWRGNLVMDQWKRDLPGLVELLTIGGERAEVERALSVVQRLRRRLDDGDANVAAKAADLDAAAPGWRDWHLDTFLRTCELLHMHWIEAGRLPRTESPDASEEEMRLARFVGHYRLLYMQGNLDQERIDALNAAAPGWHLYRDPKSAKWYSSQAKVAAQCALTGRFPARKPGQSDEVNRLAGRLRAARLQERGYKNIRGRMTDERRAYLDAAIPGWRTVDRKALAEVFPAEARTVEGSEFVLTANLVASFKILGGELPRKSVNAPKPERRLGAWLGEQTTAFRDGDLADWQITYLDRLVPGWSAGVSRGRRSFENRGRLRAVAAVPEQKVGEAIVSGENRIDQIEAHVAEHGRLPRSSSTAPRAEKRLGDALTHLRRMHRSGTLPKTVRRRLDGIFDGWENVGPGRPTVPAEAVPSKRAA